MRYYIRFTTNNIVTELVYKAQNEASALEKFEKDMKRNPNFAFVSISNQSAVKSPSRSYHAQTSSLAKKQTSKGSARALIG